METEKEFKLCVHDSYCTSSGVYVCVCVDPEIFFSELFFCRKAYPEWRDILQALLTVVGISVVPMPSLSDAVVVTAALNGM